MAYKDHACQDKKIRTCDMARLNTDFQNFFFSKFTVFRTCTCISWVWGEGGWRVFVKIIVVINVYFSQFTNNKQRKIWT